MMQEELISFPGAVLKCLNCNREFEITKETIMFFCGCGFMNEIKLGDENEVY